MNEEDRIEHTVMLIQKERLRLSKYYVPYTIQEAENTNTYRGTGQRICICIHKHRRTCTRY